MTRKLLWLTLIPVSIFIGCTAQQESSFQRDINFNRDWKFCRLDSNQINIDQEFQLTALRDDDWQTVILPHTPRIEPLVVNDQWQGICWYRKHFTIDPLATGKKVYIEFEGAMQVADIWLNGIFLSRHEGGYLPFTIEITQALHFDQENILAVKLDNRDNPEVPPGKPLKQLDFCMYGGLYRNVKLHILNPVHISDAVTANQVAGGGVFVRCENVSQSSADILIQTHIVNTGLHTESMQVISRLIDETGVEIKQVAGTSVTLPAGTGQQVVQQMSVDHPNLWHPDHPYLYILESRIIDHERILDELKTSIGIRTISFSAANGFQINGEKFYLRGTNQHQEYPYIGYALSDNALYRDACKIKNAGFDYIRLSHYPHAPAFMTACDKLGLLVMDCIPGWQFMGNEKFKQLCYQNCRDMIHRDRNHPSVILWEVSLNETFMDSTFINGTHQIAHEEYPGNQCYTCGWMDQTYDVFIQARQHGGCKNYKHGNKACVISEYGDWEYYAQNAGLDQPGFRDLKAEERNSRQLRGSGEKRLLQQAMNFQEAHNDNRSTPAVGDGLWVMYDYNRGYDNTLEASGVMDIFRIPKLSYFFFKSQRDADQQIRNEKVGAMVYIANYWTRESPADIRIFSNCQKVALYQNGKLIEIREPDRNMFTNDLVHPPFTFRRDTFTPGHLKAVGIIDDTEVAEDSVQTPGDAKRLDIEFDLSGKTLSADGADVIFVYAKIVDKKGTVVPYISIPVEFNLKGSAELIGSNPVQAEAGIATILLKSGLRSGPIEVNCSAKYADQLLTGKSIVNSY